MSTTQWTIPFTARVMLKTHFGANVVSPEARPVQRQQKPTSALSFRICLSHAPRLVWRFLATGRPRTHEGISMTRMAACATSVSPWGQPSLGTTSRTSPCEPLAATVLLLTVSLRQTWVTFPLPVSTQQVCLHSSGHTNKVRTHGHTRRSYAYKRKI